MSKIFIMDNREILTAKYLNQQFIEWEKKKGIRKDIIDFAEYLNVSQPSLSRWMSGEQCPGEESAYKISKKLGPEILEILGIKISKEIRQFADYKEVYLLTTEELRDKLVNLVKDWSKDPNAQGINIKLSKRPP